MMKVLIVVKKSNPKAFEAAIVLSTYLSSQGIGCELCDWRAISQVEDRGPFDLAVVLGGDGTVLRASERFAGTGTPLLAVNYGTVGFLANDPEPGIVEIVAAALSGDVVEERRVNVEAEVYCEDAGAEDGEAAPRRFIALNEVAVTRGSSGRMLDYDLGISGDKVCSIRGDGLVIATATGSTAYALSAGGPIVAPSFRGLVLVPLAPYTITARSIVTAQNDVAEMVLTSEKADAEVTVFADGRRLDFEAPIKRIVARRSDAETIFLSYRKDGFYRQVARTFF